MSSFLSIGSLLTDPVCWMHAYWHKTSVVDEYYPGENSLMQAVHKGIFLAKAAFWGGVALFATVPGIVCRGLGAYLRERPFEWVQGKTDQAEKSPWTAYFRNYCGVPGGYALTDGNVSPWEERIDCIALDILGKNADVTTHCEIFDRQMAEALIEKLKPHGYADFLYDAGAQAVGPGSTLFVASKFPIQNPHFEKFPLDALHGRARHAAKGVLQFDLTATKATKVFARVFVTHFQHSEIPANPEEGEKEAREKEVGIVMNLVKKTPGDRAIILTGDLNMDEAEFSGMNFDPLERAYTQGSTWGGDEFCAKLVGKKISKSCTLDYALYHPNRVASCSAKLEPFDDYDPGKFSPKAISDHGGIFITITSGSNQ